MEVSMVENKDDDIVAMRDLGLEKVLLIFGMYELTRRPILYLRHPVNLKEK